MTADGTAVPRRLHTDPLPHPIPPESPPLDQEPVSRCSVPQAETSQAHPDASLSHPPSSIQHQACPCSHPHPTPISWSKPTIPFAELLHHPIPSPQGSSQRRLFRKEIRDFPGDPVTKTLHSQYRGSEFYPWLGN